MAKKIQTTASPIAAPTSGRSTIRRARLRWRMRESNVVGVNRHPLGKRKGRTSAADPAPALMASEAGGGSVDALLHQRHDLVDIVLGDEEPAIVDHPRRPAWQHAIADVGGEERDRQVALVERHLR